MSNGIPSYQEILSKIVTTKKMSEQKAKELIEKKKKDLGGFVESDATAAWLVAKDLKVELPVISVGKTTWEMVQIRDVLTKYIDGGRFGVKGYLIARRGIEKEDGKQYKFVRIIDETGSIEIMIFKSAFDKWESIKLNDLVEVTNVSVRPKSKYSFGDFSGIEKINDDKFPRLETMLKDILNEPKPTVDIYCRAEGLIIDLVNYECCMTCLKKIANCKCDKDKQEHVSDRWNSMILSNGKENYLKAQWMPSKPKIDTTGFMGSFISVVGEYNAKYDNMTIDSYVVRQLKKAVDYEKALGKEKLLEHQASVLKLLEVCGAGGFESDGVVKLLKGKKLSDDEAILVINSLADSGKIKRESDRLYIVGGT